MTNVIARFFRWNNSRLITGGNVVLEKIHKIVLVFSLIAYRRAGSKASGQSTKVLIRNFDGDIAMRIDRSRAMGAALFWTGFHEFREFQFLHRYLKPDMVFVDIGANQGEYTLFAAKRLPSGTVLAFEPLPSMRATLEENVSMNGFRNIVIFPLGLSSKEETLTIHEIADAHEGLATLFPGDRSSTSATEVLLKRLDDVVDPDRVDFVKIDIEGGELRALEGCRRILRKHKPAFLVEINATTYRAAGYSPVDVFNFFDGEGYSSFEIGMRGVIIPNKVMPEFGNVVFLPR